MFKKKFINSIFDDQIIQNTQCNECGIHFYKEKLVAKERGAGNPTSSPFNAFKTKKNLIHSVRIEWFRNSFIHIENTTIFPNKTFIRFKISLYIKTIRKFLEGRPVITSLTFSLNNTFNKKLRYNS